MIVFLLLIIISILLFGSAVVLRGIGVVLGIIALFFAIVVGISIGQQVPVWLWWTIGIVIFGGITLIVVADARQQAKLRRDIADIEARSRAFIARNQEEARQPIDKFYNDGLNKKKRKKLAIEKIDHAARRKLLAPENQKLRLDLLKMRSRIGKDDNA